ncbi:sensor histidine kinase [Ramlibacter sp. AN1133]|uniref:sensor histidine kinase n=1 Tax=Ramlibacter sp. AN1133 TaxID=3133429 RepID=UPI0030BDA3C0
MYANPPKVVLQDGQRPQGIFVDVLEQIAREEGGTLHYVPGTFQEGLDRLERGEVDLMVDVARTPERERHFELSREAVLSTWNQVYARPGLGIRNLLDLKGRRLAVLAGSVQEQFFREAAQSFGVEARILTFPTFDAAFRAVREGRADAVVANPFFGEEHLAGLDDTAIIFGPSTLHFAARKGSDPALMAGIDAHLLRFKADPASVYSVDYQQLMRLQTTRRVPAWLYPALATGLLVLLLSAGWTWTALRAAARLRVSEQRQRQLAAERMALLRSVEQRSAEIERANEDLQIVSYSLSHDLGAPLAAIRGFVAATLDGWRDSLDPRAARMLERALAGAGRIDAMLLDLAGLLRVAGEPLDPACCDLTQLAHDVVDTLRARHEIDAVVTVAPGLQVRADARLMRVVLENLIGNAWKFASRVPSPRIELGEVDGAPDRPTFFVRDNGAGFDMEYASRLFRPFSRLHDASEFPGAGIGLSIVQRIVARHGGRVWAEGAVGRGATFYFTLEGREDAGAAAAGGSSPGA